MSLLPRLPRVPQDPRQLAAALAPVGALAATAALIALAAMAALSASGCAIADPCTAHHDCASASCTSKRPLSPAWIRAVTDNARDPASFVLRSR